MSASTSRSVEQAAPVRGWRSTLFCTLLITLAMLSGIALARSGLLSDVLIWTVPVGILLAGCLLALGLWWRDRRQLRTGIAPDEDKASGASGDVATAADTDEVDTEAAPGGLSAIRFHQMVAEAFRRRGYRVITRKGGPDLSASADLILEKGGRSYFVQCGLWKTSRVGVTAVRKLHEHVQAAGVQGGYLVTTGVFTGEALALARETGIEAVDGTRLRALMRGGKG